MEIIAKVLIAISFSIGGIALLYKVLFAETEYDKWKKMQDKTQK